jgi:hypothetical protein
LEQQEFFYLFRYRKANKKPDKGRQTKTREQKLKTRRYPDEVQGGTVKTEVTDNKQGDDGRSFGDLSGLFRR